jgi:lipopolysaccharide transport system permease protein
MSQGTFLPTQRITLIQPEPSASGYWSDLWRQRELLYFLAWRDLIVRYRQTAIGVAWAVLRPLLVMAALTLAFGVLAKLPSEGVPYLLLVAAGILPWQFFANAMSESGSSLVENSSMVTKVYFPRMIVPIGALLVCLADFAVSFSILALLMAWFGVAPDWRVVTLPLYFALLVASSVGAGLWLAALNVKYRDFRHALPFAVQITLYLSPVGFSSTLMPDGWRLLCSLNPLFGVIDGFRWALFSGQAPLFWPGLIASTASGLLLLYTGVRYFRSTENYFADVI